MVVHGHVRPQPIPLLRPLLGVLPSVMQPDSTLPIQKEKVSELSHQLTVNIQDWGGFAVAALKDEQNK